MKTEKGIGKINYGELHFYYPIRFDTSKNFDELCDLIQESPINLSESKINKIYAELSSIASSCAEYMNEDAKLERQYKVVFAEHKDDLDRTDFPTEDFKLEDILIEFQKEGDSLKTVFQTTELLEYMDFVGRLEENEQRSRKIYGDKYMNAQVRFLLAPLKVDLCNGEKVWLKCLLYLFENKMAVFKMELPLSNVDAEPLYNNNPDAYIRCIYNRWGLTYIDETSTLDSIVKGYMQEFHEYSKVDIYRYLQDIKNIILVDFENMPNSLDNISDAIQFDLYKMICAPVPNNSISFYKKEAKKYVANYTWRMGSCEYVIKSNGGCLSFFENHAKNTGLEVEKSKEDRLFYYRAMAENLCINCEFALLHVILKKAISSASCYEKTSRRSDYRKTKIQYNHNILFLHEFEGECYGSAKEQGKEFEEKMFLYLNKEETEEKMKAIDNILQEEESEKAEAFNKRIAILGLLFSIFFGLPTIRETLLLLRGIMDSWIPTDIPFISINGISLFLWLALNFIILFVCVLRNYNLLVILKGIIYILVHRINRQL